MERASYSPANCAFGALISISMWRKSALLTVQLEALFSSRAADISIETRMEGMHFERQMHMAPLFAVSYLTERMPMFKLKPLAISHSIAPVREHQ